MEIIAESLAESRKKGQRTAAEQSQIPQFPNLPIARICMERNGESASKKSLWPKDQKEAMPMILDDVLREYDETRSQNALQFLGQQNNQHQLIFFTCHKHLCPLAEDVGFKVKTV